MRTLPVSLRLDGRRCVVDATKEGPSLFRLVDGAVLWE